MVAYHTGGMNAQRPDVETRDAAVTSDPRGRGQLLRDVAVFQLKLFVDGLRDLMLVPVSLIAALIDVLTAGRKQHFYEVVRFGRRTEHWIRLFSAADHLDDHPHETGQESIDEIVARVEGKLREQHARRRVRRRGDS